MRSTEVVNARLLRAQSSPDAAAGGDTFDTGGGAGVPGPEKWAGDVGAFYEERSQRTLGQGGANVFVWRWLTVREELGIAWEEGDVVTFTAEQLDGQQTGSVSAVEPPHAPPGSGGDVLLTLDVT